MTIDDFKEILIKQIEQDAMMYPIKWARHRNGYPALRMKAIKRNKTQIKSIIQKTKTMNIKVTSPKDMNTTTTESVRQVVEKFELKLSKQDKSESYYHLVISGEYNRATLDEVEKIYKDAGWIGVRCKTSTENGERGGLTGLQLSSTKELLKP